MSEKRRGLGRGLGALIPTAPPPAKGGGDRPVDVFFPGKTDDEQDAAAEETAAEAAKPGGGAAGGERPRPASKRQPVPPITVEDPALEDLVAAAAAEIAAEDSGVETPSAKATTEPAAKPTAAPAADAAPKPGPPPVPSQGAGAKTETPKPAKATEPAKPAAPVEAKASEPAKGVEPSSPAEPAVTAEPAKGAVKADAPAPMPSATAPVQPAAASSGPELVPVPGAYFAEVPVGSVRANPRQPRQVFEEEALAELVHSIKEIGVLQPIVVRPLPATPDGEASYELIMGERRLRASKEAGLETIPAIVRETQDDDMLRDALLENLHRSELNALEEAAAYQQLLDDFGCTHEELATRIGRSRPQISNTIRLLRLPPAVQRRVAAGVLSAGHARALLGLENAEAMDKLAQRIVNEGLSVRATEEAVAVSDGDVPAARRKPRAGGKNAELDDLASRLADRLDTRVSIALGRSKGKLSVEFASVEDLNRILELLAPEVRGAFQGVK